MSCNKCSNSPLAENGFYTHPCSEVLEDHARHVIVHQYVGCIKIANSWAIPEGENSVSLDVPALVDVMVGCYLWNPTYGHFEIIHYDPGRQKVKVLATIDTQEAGTVVPSCTQFIFTDSPGFGGED